MDLEQTKKRVQKELERKDEDMEELKSNYIRKVAKIWVVGIYSIWLKIKYSTFLLLPAGQDTWGSVGGRTSRSFAGGKGEKRIWPQIDGSATGSGAFEGARQLGKAI